MRIYSRLTSIVLFLVLLIVSFPVSISGATGQESEKQPHYSFTEDFEGKSNGVSLDSFGWRKVNNVLSANVSSDPTGSSNKAGLINCGGDNSRMEYLISPVSGRLIIAFKVYVTDKKTYQLPRLQGTLKAANSLAEACVLVYDPSGKIVLNGTMTPISYKTNAWQSYKIVVDTTKNEGVMDLYQDDKNVINNLALMNDVSNISYIGMAGGKDSKVYFDDIKIGNIENADNVSLGLMPADTGENGAYPAEMNAFTEQDKIHQRKEAARIHNEIIAAYQRGEKEYTIPPGYYRTGNSQLSGFHFYGMENFTINAYGVNMIRENTGDALQLYNCRNVTLKGLSIDFDPLYVTQGTITKIDKENKKIEVDIHSGFPIPDARWVGGENGRIAFYIADGSCQIPNNAREFLGSLDYLGGRSFRMGFVNSYMFQYNSNVNVGDNIVAINRKSAGRAITNLDCTGLLFEDFNIYASAAITIMEQGGEGGNIYRRIKVVRRPNTKRLFVTTADGFHSVGVIKGPTVEDCEFSDIGDDYMNIHGIMDMVYCQPYQDEVILTTFDRQDNRYPVGEELQFYDAEDLLMLDSAKIVESEAVYDNRIIENAMMTLKEGVTQVQGLQLLNMIPTGVFRVKLDKPVKVHPYDLVNARNRTGMGTVIRNNYFHNGLIRGILVSSKDALIENNVLERTGGGALFIMADMYYLAGAFPENIIVRNNKITDSNFQRRTETPGAITLLATPTIGNGKLYETRPIKNITIENNTITRSAVCGIFGINLSGATIQNNTISAPYNMKPEADAGKVVGVKEPYYAIYIDASENVTLKGNQFDNIPDTIKGNIGIGNMTDNINEIK